MTEFQNIFQEKGFIYIKGLTDTSTHALFVDKLLELGKGKTNDLQVPGSISFYKEPIFEKLLLYLLPLVENYTGYSLHKTYSYARKYNLGDELKPHTDRHACEITVSLCLRNESKPWPIWVMDKKGQAHSFVMEAGDAVIFKGIELNHWREPNIYGICSQVFLHYVNQYGIYANQKDDRKQSNNPQGHY